MLLVFLYSNLVSFDELENVSSSLILQHQDKVFTHEWGCHERFLVDKKKSI